MPGPFLSLHAELNEWPNKWARTRMLLIISFISRPAPKNSDDLPGCF